MSLVTDQDLVYDEFPTIISVDVAINTVIETAMENKWILIDDQDIPTIILENKVLLYCEANDFADRLLNKTLLGKISATLDNTSFDHNDGPLFTTTSDDLQSEFQSEVSGI